MLLNKWVGELFLDVNKLILSQVKVVVSRADLSSGHEENSKKRAVSVSKSAPYYLLLELVQVIVDVVGSCD